MTDKTIDRLVRNAVTDELEFSPAVILLGPRQVGKTTLAKHIASEQPSVFYNLEKNSKVNQRLAEDTSAVLEEHTGKLVVIDEVQKIPGIFGPIMVQIDQSSHLGKHAGQFLLLGSASAELLKQSQTLTGRVETIYMHGLNLLEVGGMRNLERLLQRGGFPSSYTAKHLSSSRRWLSRYLRHLKNDVIPELEAGADPEKLEALLKLIAHAPGRIIKSKVEKQLKMSDTTVQKYLNTLHKLLLINKLPAYASNIDVQVRKMPKYYLCDIALSQYLCRGRIAKETAQKHKFKQGLRWEGFVIENLRSVLPEDWRTYYFRTQDGKNEIDLLIQTYDGDLWAIEIKSSYQLSFKPSFTQALDSLNPERAILLHGDNVPRKEKLEQNKRIEIVSLQELMQELLDYKNMDHNAQSQSLLL